MTHKGKTLKDLLLKRISREEAALRQHPDVAVLADYLDDLLTEPEVEEIREHLSICRACRKELDHLDEPMEEVEAYANLPAEEKARQRMLLNPALNQRKPLYQRLGFAYALGFIMLLGWLGTLWRGSSPAALTNPDQAYLSPMSTSAPRETVPQQEIVLEADSPGLLLTLNLSNMEGFSAYVLEIYEDPRPEQPRNKVRGLTRKRGGNFTVFLPREMLAEGDFWFVIKGARGPLVEELAAYQAKVLLP